MEAKVSKKEAFDLAEQYREKYGFNVKFGNIDDCVVFYESFYRINGPIWLVIGIGKTNFFGDTDKVSFIVSALEKKVFYAIDTIGSPIDVDKLEDNELTKEEILELMSDEDDIEGLSLQEISEMYLGYSVEDILNGKSEK